MNAVQNIVAQIFNDPVPAMNQWKRHNCPACVYRGQGRPDTRSRGNHMFNSDGGIAYNCFNCHLKVAWTPGIYMSKDFKSLLSYFGANEQALAYLDLYVKEMINNEEFKHDSPSSKLFQSIQPRELPNGSKTFLEWANSDNPPKEFLSVLNAVHSRNPYILDLELYWCPSKEYNLYDRFIVPYYMNNKVIGYTARHKDPDPQKSLRYINQVSTGILYNYDLLNDSRIKTILVPEGPIDAALMGGVSVNNYFLSKAQIELLKNEQEKGKTVVIVPDRDKNGLEAIDQAIEHGFSVALPDFGLVKTENGFKPIKDFDEACVKYGRIFCLQLIHNSIFHTKFQIQSRIGNSWSI